MNKKKLLIFVVFILLSLALFFRGPDLITGCQSLQRGFSSGVSGMNLTVGCYTNLAVEEKNTKWCDVIGELNSATERNKSSCYGEVARATNDVNLCKHAIYEEGCIADIAKSTQNITKCQSIMDVYRQRVCEIEYRNYWNNR